MKAAILGCVILFSAGANARELPLPVPPIPPTLPPSIDAPVPNLDATGPYVDQGRTLVTLDTEINHRIAPTPGLGYSPGARYQLDNDRRVFVLPGLMMHLPLP